MTPQKYLFDGCGVGCVGISGQYHSVNGDEIKLDGTLKGFFEVVYEYCTSHECGWFGHVELFSILHLLAIN